MELSELSRPRATSFLSATQDIVNPLMNDEQESLITNVRISSSPLARDSCQSGETVLAAKPVARHKKSKLQGWRFGVALCVWIVTTVFLANTALIIYVSTHFAHIDGIGTAYEGSCNVANSVTTWIHVLINGLSSILLGASNYTMQTLSSPTRSEVDQAHHKGDYMDIGVASVHNLFRIKRNRRALWVVIALSSVPIHLLFNSALFKGVDANLYVAVVANEEWLASTGGSEDEAPYISSTTSLESVRSMFTQDAAYLNETLFKRMNTSQCIEAYGTSFVSAHNHVVAVTNRGDTARAFLATQISYNPSDGLSYNWLCAFPPQPPKTRFPDQTPDNSKKSQSRIECDSHALNATVWTINGSRIDHCYSQITPQRCKIQFSIHIMVAVVICNFIKSACMFLTLFNQQEAPLVTVGDAIASYLDDADLLTKSRCLMSRTGTLTTVWNLEDCLQGTGVQYDKDVLNTLLDTEPAPIQYLQRRPFRWCRAASQRRWTFMIALLLIMMTTATICVNIGLKNSFSTTRSLFSLGFGTIDARNLIDWSLPAGSSVNLLYAVLLANTPQALVSFLYLVYNSIMTSMLLAKEWSSYSRTRKPLRVTDPHGQQRSTYWLQLPFRYSLPFIVISSTLHWVISQSIFLVRVDVYDNGVPVDNSKITQAGYSYLPTLVAILIGIVLLIAAAGLGSRKYMGQIPVVGSCSMAISAACHPPADDADAACLPVQWGEVRSQPDDSVGHCCFTSKPVDELLHGRMYAGQKGSS